MSKENGSDPRVKRTREVLAQAFIKLLGEKGFEAMTVQDITAYAAVNRATFYAHFTDKFALLEHIIRHSFQQALQSKLPEEPPFSLDNLRLLILTVCEHLEDFKNLQCRASSKQFEPLMEREVQRQVYQLVLRWVAEAPAAQQRPPIAPEVIASSVSWTILGAGVHWRQNDKQASVQAIADQVLRLITHGLFGALHSEKT
ncbi:MAG: TetR/AcrR family transcriptional regulator [Caldilineaceae bacterium]